MQQMDPASAALLAALHQPGSRPGQGCDAAAQAPLGQQEPSKQLTLRTGSHAPAASKTYAAVAACPATRAGVSIPPPILRANAPKPAAIPPPNAHLPRVAPNPLLLVVRPANGSPRT